MLISRLKYHYKRTLGLWKFQKHPFVREVVNRGTLRKSRANYVLETDMITLDLDIAAECYPPSVSIGFDLNNLYVAVVDCDNKYVFETPLSKMFKNSIIRTKLANAVEFPDYKEPERLAVIDKISCNAMLRTFIAKFN